MPIFLETLTVALQIGLSNPKYLPPSGNPVRETKVESISNPYIKKELVTDTFVTIDDPPPPQKPVYKPTQRPIIKNVEVIGESYEQCVIYAKRKSGITKSIGYAGSAQPEGQEPKVGVIALQNSIGHAVYVEQVLENGIVASESNYRRGYITRRFIAYSDIRGYVY